MKKNNKNSLLSFLSAECQKYVLENKPNIYYSMMSILGYRNFTDAEEFAQFYTKKYSSTRKHIARNKKYVKEVASLCWKRYFEEGEFFEKIYGEVEMEPKMINKNVTEFKCDSFVKENENDFVVFVTGSCDYNTHKGSFKYQTNYKGRAIAREEKLDYVKSSNVAMLLAIKDALQKIKLENENVWIIAPTKLGFTRAQKSANAQLVSDIREICESKRLKIQVKEIEGIAQEIKKMINSSRKIQAVQQETSEVKHYNKLVRDLIPEIIEADGKTCVTKVLDDKTYLEMIDAKFDEELAEYHKDQNIEELADILELIYAATKARGYTIEQLEQVRAKKAEKRGAFDKKILLVEVEEK